MRVRGRGGSPRPDHPIRSNRQAWFCSQSNFRVPIGRQPFRGFLRDRFTLRRLTECRKPFTGRRLCFSQDFSLLMSAFSLLISPATQMFQFAKFEKSKERRLATELGYGFPIGDPWITDGVSQWPFASESGLSPDYTTLESKKGRLRLLGTLESQDSLSLSSTPTKKTVSFPRLASSPMDKSASNQPSSQARSTPKSYGSLFFIGLALSLRQALLLVRFPDKGMLEGIGFNPPSGLGGAYIEIGLNAMPLKSQATKRRPSYEKQIERRGTWHTLYSKAWTTLNRLSPFRDGTALVPPSEIETEMKAFLFSLVYSPLFEPPYGLRPAETIETQAAHKVTKRMSLLKMRRKAVEEIARTRHEFPYDISTLGWGGPSFSRSLRRGLISYLIVGVAIGFASTTAFPAVETLSENGPKAPKPRTETEAFRFTPHSLLNKKARPGALGRSAGSFSVVLFPPRERRGKRYAQHAEDPLRVFIDLERYYKSSVPDSIAAAIWFTGTTKSLMLTLLLLMV
ncbi:hypothetical protein ACH5RR_023671 [Cinchona calisaya]|uniref:Uncharacterized protein n=1 Tax=Cinchona calisaya TaxID=153742 RepID=A0ABD2ZCE2_9GENT